MFKHLPAEQVHPQAVPAAIAAECAGKEGKFWEMHDLLFESPASLDDEHLVARAARLGLRGDFGSCMQSDIIAKVREDARFARSIGIRSTPTSLFGRIESNGTVAVIRTLVGARSVMEFVRAIEAVLADSRRR
jgi:protein-disulfide isomerase